MYRVTLPSPVLYVTPDQLPRFLANIAETRYQAESGEFLQTTTTHELAKNVTTATLLISTPIEAVTAERDQYRTLWQQTRDNLEKANVKLDKVKKVTRRAKR